MNNKQVLEALEQASDSEFWGSLTIQFRRGKPQFIRVETTKPVNAEEREQNDSNYNR